MKKFLAASFLVFLLSNVAFALTFPDVGENHENYRAIEYLHEKEVIHGYENGNFGPGDNLTRAQAMKIIMEAFNVKRDGDYEASFPDVIKSDWFFPYVMGAKAAEIVHGYPDGTFKPDRPVNLAEALKLIILAAELDLPEVKGSFVFSDVPLNEWFAPHFYYAREKNILVADDEGNVYPAENMTRGAFSELVYRTMIVKEEGGEAYPIEETWPVYEGTNLPFRMSYDPSWAIIKNTGDVTFYKPDKDNAQFSPTKVYPNSAKIMVTLDKNEEGFNSSNYFLNIRNVFPDAKYTEFNMDGFKAMEVSYSENNTVDWYIYLSNNYVLVVYTEYGDGNLSFQFPKTIKTMLSTLEYKEVALGIDYEEVLSEIFENVLVEDTGMEMLGMLDDKVIIETDSIGVGTGPIDYYYSEAVNYTFKYERSKDTILATKQGRTSAF